MISSLWTAKAVSCRCCNCLAEPDSERGPGLKANRVALRRPGCGDNPGRTPSAGSLRVLCKGFT